MLGECAKNVRSYDASDGGDNVSPFNRCCVCPSFLCRTASRNAHSNNEGNVTNCSSADGNGDARSNIEGNVTNSSFGDGNGDAHSNIEGNVTNSSSGAKSAFGEASSLGPVNSKGNGANNAAITDGVGNNNFTSYIDERNETGRTPLYLAVLEGSKSAVPFLINRGANFKHINDLSQTRAGVLLDVFRKAFNDIEKDEESSCSSCEVSGYSVWVCRCS